VTTSRERLAGRRRRLTPGVPRPPGPSGISLLRAFTSSDPSDPVHWFERTAREYPGICHVWAPGRHTYVVSDAALVHELLHTHGRYLRKGAIFEVMKSLFGEGLLTSDADLHRRQRRLLQPAFHHGRIARYAEYMVTAAEAHQRGWRDGETVDMAAQMLALTLTIVGKTLFGSDLRGDVAMMGRALQAALVGLRQVGYLPLGSLILSLPLPTSRRTRAAVTEIDTAVRRVISQRRDADEVTDTGDLMSMLVLASEDGQGMDDRQVRDEVVTILLAGHETTAMALTWTWYLLASHPEQGDLLADELSSVLGDRDPTAADFAQLPRTRAIIAEAMRLYPPAWGFSRTVNRELVLGGWTIPAGSVCAVSQWALHRDPRYWQDPHSYLPERWLRPDGGFDESQPGQPRGAWFPFGMGNRICIGEHFAWMEAVLVIATICRRWRPELVADHPVRVEGDLTLRTAHGMRVTLHRR
jgi:cytochrome P450